MTKKNNEKNGRFRIHNWLDEQDTDLYNDIFFLAKYNMEL